MAFINFIGNVGENSEDSYDKKKEEGQVNLNEYNEEDYSKAESKLDKINKCIEEKEKKLEDLEDDILEKEGILKDLKIDILQRKNIIKDLELEFLQGEARLKNLELEISNKYKQGANIKIDGCNNIKPMSFDEWRDRELEKVYSVVFTDMFKLKIQKKEKSVLRYVYSAIGVNIKGERDVLGIWIFNEESVKYWLDVFEDLKDRGVGDILIVSIPLIDGLKKEILGLFPKAKVELSITDEMRMSNKYIYYKDLKSFDSDLKKIYLSSTEEIAIKEYDELKKKWKEKYPIAMKMCEENLEDLSLIFKYPEEVRKILYATNTLDKYNDKLKKVVKDTYETSSNDEIIEKIYLEIIELTYKWKRPIRGWVEVLSKLSMIFKSRVNKQLL